MFTSPSEWYSLSPGGRDNNEQAAYTWIEEKAPCCKHCVWNLGYPVIDPIVIATDRVNTNASEHLDCRTFETEFLALDVDASNSLDLDEIEPYLNYGINKWLSENKRLNKEALFEQTDLNMNGVVSLNEWYVLRHFWAPVHVANAGPLPISQAENMEDGTLGGLFWDINLIEIFMTQTVNILLEQVVASKCWGCGCCPDSFDPCPESCSWQSGYVREFTAREQNTVLRSIDLDGSTRVSLEEHYFRNFADRNGDEVLDREEYELSLYGHREVPFDQVDLNADGNITFLERKFVRADVNHDELLEKAEWLKADLPEYFGPFDGHVVSGHPWVNSQTYTYYSALHECALEGVRAYQVAFSSHPWAPACVIQTHVSVAGPWIREGEIIETSRKLVGGALDRRANGEEEPKTSYMISMWKEVGARLKWNTQLNYVPTKAELQDPSILRPPDTAQRVFHVGLFASFPETKLSDDLVCTRSFAPSLDGFVVVVASKPEDVSLTTAVLIMLVSHSFVNFSCFLFVALIGVGHVYWFIEKDANSEQFNPSYGRGIMDAAWFCIVTMSTVGYGDKTPATGLGKGLTVFWMLFGIINFGIFTGEISAQVNLLSAEAAIKDFETLAGFEAGVWDVTQHLKLAEMYQFTPRYCSSLDDCFKLLSSKKVPALVLPQADVLSYFLNEGLATADCGNPFAIQGEPVLQGSAYSAKLCSYGKSVFAAQYIIDGVNEVLEELEKEGFTEDRIRALTAQVEDTSSADACSPPDGYRWELIITALVIIVLYWIIINYINHRKRVASGKLLRAMFSTSNKTPEQIALYFGLKWRQTARRFAEIRKAGGPVPRPTVTQAANEDDRLLNYLKRVRLIASGQTQDLQRCQKDVDAVSTVTNIANNFMFAACLVLLGLTAAVIYSLDQILGAKDRYLELREPAV